MKKKDFSIVLLVIILTAEFVSKATANDFHAKSTVVINRNQVSAYRNSKFKN